MGQVFVKASRRAKAHTRKRPSVLRDMRRVDNLIGKNQSRTNRKGKLYAQALNLEDKLVAKYQSLARALALKKSPGRGQRSPSSIRAYRVVTHLSKVSGKRRVYPYRINL